jgi:Asp-tRNA(Asn)/Glu-tRNA(Gln) amidotransferase C subunit
MSSDRLTFGTPIVRALVSDQYALDSEDRMKEWIYETGAVYIKNARSPVIKSILVICVILASSGVSAPAYASDDPCAVERFGQSSSEADMSSAASFLLTNAERLETCRAIIMARIADLSNATGTEVEWDEYSQQLQQIISAHHAQLSEIVRTDGLLETSRVWLATLEGEESAIRRLYAGNPAELERRISAHRQRLQRLQTQISTISEHSEVLNQYVLDLTSRRPMIALDARMGRIDKVIDNLTSFSEMMDSSISALRTLTDDSATGPTGQ